MLRLEEGKQRASVDHKTDFNARQPQQPVAPKWMNYYRITVIQHFLENNAPAAVATSSSSRDFFCPHERREPAASQLFPVKKKKKGKSPGWQAGIGSSPSSSSASSSSTSSPALDFQQVALPPSTGRCYCDKNLLILVSDWPLIHDSLSVVYSQVMDL